MRRVADAPRRPGRLLLFARRVRRLGWPAVAGTGALALAGAGIALWQSGMFSAPAAELGARILAGSAEAGLTYQALEVTGRVHTPPALLHEAIGFRRGAPLLAISPAEVKGRLERVPWIEEVTVGRRFPDTLFVRITERRPFAIWQHQGRFAVIDRSGHVITDTSIRAFGPLPLVVGAGAEARAALLLDLIEQYPEVKARLAAAIRVGERRWTLQLASGAALLLPEGAEEAAIERAAELHARHGLLDRALAAIDMRLADRLVLRPAGDAAQPAAAEAAGPARAPRRQAQTAATQREARAAAPAPRPTRRNDVR